MASAFHDAASRRDPVGMLRQAALYASLWAIGSSWSVAIREIVTAIVPTVDDDDGDENEWRVVLAELGAAATTTLLAICATLGATARCGGRAPLSAARGAASSAAAAADGARTPRPPQGRPPSTRPYRPRLHPPRLPSRSPLPT